MAYGFPALLKKSGSCGTRYAQTVLAEIPRLFCAARHGSRGIESQNHPSTVILSAAKNPEGWKCLIKGWILRYAQNDK